MEFVEAVNPHYAFPIVGVIVCCLLVFAFGFKSPGQPPSFDIVEEERKVVKKRKGKENQKVKLQQNGKVTSAVPAKVEASPHTPKTKVAAEKPGTKSESKSSKKSRSQQVAKQVEVGNKSEVVQSEEGNEDGWVQLVSKKERKNRKKDDVAPSFTDVAKTVPAVAEVEACLQVSEDLEKPVSSKEEAIQAEKVNDTFDSVIVKESLEDTKSTPKVPRTPKKKKGKKDEEASVESNAMNEIPAPEVSEFPIENGISSENKSYSSVLNSNTIVEPPADDLLQVHEMADASEEEVKSKAKKKKNKKKNQEAATIEDIKIENNSVCAQEHNEVVEQQTIPKKEIIVEPKLIDVELQDNDDRKAESEEPVSAPGSNVVFDELKDLCQEEKPQKKKKKVRREH